jgi:hypothetical protein
VGAHSWGSWLYSSSSTKSRLTQIQPREASHCKAVNMAFLSATANAAETLMTDTIKTGTMPIEESALMPGFLRFESEPWTPFYMAGESIRESRKASGKQSKYASEGNMAHSDEVIDHYNHLRNVGSLSKDGPNVGTGLVGEPECGSVTKLQMKINSETQVIEEAEFKMFGCGSAIANSTRTTEWVKGKSSRKRWPSRTRISSVSSAFPRAILLNATGYSGIGGRLHFLGSSIL